MHRSLIGDRLTLDCSVNIEQALFDQQRSGEKVFDYLIVLKADCRSRFVEVHPASSTKRVAEVIGKKRSTESMLVRAGIQVSGSEWFWLVPGEGTVKFTSGSRYGKMLAQAKIKQPKRRMTT